MSLRAAIATQLLAAFKINISDHSINALNAICLGLNSFRIKSAQSSGRRREKISVEWPIYRAHRAVLPAIARHLVVLISLVCAPPPLQQIRFVYSDRA